MRPSRTHADCNCYRKSTQHPVQCSQGGRVSNFHQVNWLRLKWNHCHYHECNRIYLWTHAKGHRQSFGYFFSLSFYSLSLFYSCNWWTMHSSAFVCVSSRLCVHLHLSRALCHLIPLPLAVHLAVQTGESHYMCPLMRFHWTSDSVNNGTHALSLSTRV